MRGTERNGFVLALAAVLLAGPGSPGAIAVAGALDVGDRAPDFSLPATTAQRAFFLIDKQGIVRGKWYGTPTDRFPTETLRKAAQALAGN